MTAIVTFFAQRVTLGKSFDTVPSALKAQVGEILCESGLTDLVPEEYRKPVV